MPELMHSLMKSIFFIIENYIEYCYDGKKRAVENTSYSFLEKNPGNIDWCQTKREKSMQTIIEIHTNELFISLYVTVYNNVCFPVEIISIVK